MTGFLRSGAGGGAPRGLTLIELLVSIAVLGVLAGVAMPLVQISVTRTREMELRRALRQTRDGLDRFKAEYDKARGNAKDALADFKKLVSVDRSGYPLTLDEMVTFKVLRRIPRDPMTPDGKWITRSYSDNPESSLSDSKDVFDLRSASHAVALDGTTYDTW
ncbi:MAG TPA: prepilin-type N-terminal cleavage/methylation domain-containing protein [Candidatus Methylomirabilis sp.]|nr:prepilin-type N-terminal cleavage/methylation domain-containing protein [Candidatus Methylomirabilis sp.]